VAVLVKVSAPAAKKKGNVGFGREGHGSDGSGWGDAIQPKGRRIEPRRTQQCGSVREGHGSDGSNEGEEGEGDGAVPARQRPVLDLARDDDGAGAERSLKGKALLGINTSS
jgi:hypothetical protein